MWCFINYFIINIKKTIHIHKYVEESIMSIKQLASIGNEDWILFMSFEDIHKQINSFSFLFEFIPSSIFWIC